MHVKPDVLIQNSGPQSDVSLALWNLCV